MNKIIRIGTRSSELALWQATTVQKQLEKLGHETEIIPITSSGDLNLETPLYEMGIVGVFTKSLDIALLQDQIDIAVHSMKDVPTMLPDELVQTAVLKRGSAEDILVPSGPINLNEKCTIATSSLRRKAQWLHRYPHHKVVPLRGNVNTRLKKLKTEDWHGAIFAKAGLERINLLPEQHLELDWMLPAPAQGAVVIVAKKGNDFAIKATQLLNDRETYQTTYAERMFLRGLEGGCSAPIAAIARIIDNKIELKGNLFALDGKESLETLQTGTIEEYLNLGQQAAKEILASGGKQLMKVIKKVTARPGKA